VFRKVHRLIICCIFYIIVVRSYNSQLEMPVLQKCLNFDYSSCQSHWTTVRFSSEEISVTFTEYIRLWLVPSCCEKVTNYLRIHMDENLKTVHWSVFKNLRLLSFDTYILGTTLQHLGHYECLKNIKINFWYSFTLTVLSFNSCLQSGFFFTEKTP